MSRGEKQSGEKGWLGRFSGLSFGDRLNIGLFVLTVIAIIISLWSVRIAIVTLRKADEGGAEQLRALNSADESLDAAKTSLDASETMLEDQEKIQKATLKNVKSQVSLLQSISSQPRNRGILAVSVSCSDEQGGQQSFPTLVGYDENSKFHDGKWHSTLDLHLVPGVVYECEGHALNLGNKLIEGFEISAIFRSCGHRTVGFANLSDDHPTPPPGKTLDSNTGEVVQISKGGNLLPVDEDKAGIPFGILLNIPNHPETGGEPPSDPWCRPGDAYGHLRLRIAPTMVDYDYIDLRILREQQRAH